MPPEATPNRLSYESQGAGRPVVVVPWGPGAYGSLYRWALQPLASRCRLIHWDYRGCGRSGPAARYSMEDDLWDLASLIEVLELDRPVLLGHSYGGMVALYLATEYPELCGGLVLSNTVPAGRDLLAARARRKAALGTRDFVRWEHLAFRCIEGVTTGEEKLEYLRTEARFLVHDPRFAAPILRRLRLNFEVLAAAQESLQAFDVRARLREVTVPCLVAAGHHDLIAGDGPKAMHLKLPDSRFRRFMNSAHMPFLEEPAAFCQAVAGFLEELPPRGE